MSDVEQGRPDQGPLVESFEALARILGREPTISEVEDELTETADVDTDVWVESTGPEELIIRVGTYGAGLVYPFHLDEVNETINELYEDSEEDEPEG